MNFVNEKKKIQLDSITGMTSCKTWLQHLVTLCHPLTQMPSDRGYTRFWEHPVELSWDRCMCMQMWSTEKPATFKMYLSSVGLIGWSIFQKFKLRSDQKILCGYKIIWKAVKTWFANRETCNTFFTNSLCMILVSGI